MESQQGCLFGEEGPRENLDAVWGHDLIVLIAFVAALWPGIGFFLPRVFEGENGITVDRWREGAEEPGLYGWKVTKVDFVGVEEGPGMTWRESKGTVSELPVVP